MKYKIIEKKYGRIAAKDDFSVSRVGLSFNSKYSGKEWVLFAVNENGFLCFAFEHTADSFHLQYPSARPYLRIPARFGAIPRGDFHVTEIDEKWHVSDCKLG